MKKDLLISFLAYGVTSALSKFIGVLMLPIYTRYFSDSEYGIIDLIQTVISIVVIFGILQLETSVQRYYYEVTEEYKKKMVSTVLLFSTTISLFLMLLMLLFASRLSIYLFNSKDYTDLLIWASLIIPLTNVSSISYVILRYMKKPFLFAGITLLQVVITTVSTLLFIYKDQGVISVFYGQILGFIGLIIVQFLILRDSYSFVFDVDCLKKMLKFALPQFPARIGSTATTYMNRFMMLGVLSISAIGIYSVALKFASAISILQAAFVMSWLPFFYETLKRPDHKIIFKEYFKYVCVGVGVVIALIALFSEEIIKIFVSPEFYESGLYVGGLSLYLGLFIIKEYIDMGPRITKKTQYISYTYLLTTIVNFTLLYFLVPSTGLPGVVWSMVFTNVFLIILSWYVSEKLYYIGFSKVVFFLFILVLILIVMFMMYYSLSLTVRIGIATILIGGSVFFLLKLKQDHVLKG